jgi:hypothetical protein
VRELKRQLTRCTTQIVRLEAQVQTYRQSDAETKNRLRRLRRLKATAEDGLIVLKARHRTATRLAALQIRDHEKYAAQCLALYELAMRTVQKLVRETHAGSKTISHNCPDCGPKSILDFGVRMLPSGFLGFAPYCLNCTRRRKSAAKKVRQMDLKRVAAEFAQRTPRVAKQLVDRFTEEVEELLEEEQRKKLGL